MSLAIAIDPIDLNKALTDLVRATVGDDTGIEVIGDGSTLSIAPTISFAFTITGTKPDGGEWTVQFVPQPLVLRLTLNTDLDIGKFMSHAANRACTVVLAGPILRDRTEATVLQCLRILLLTFAHVLSPERSLYL